jgi:hypothetical protein
MGFNPMNDILRLLQLEFHLHAIFTANPGKISLAGRISPLSKILQLFQVGFHQQAIQQLRGLHQVDN